MSTKKLRAQLKRQLKENIKKRKDAERKFRKMGGYTYDIDLRDVFPDVMMDKRLR